MGCVGGAGNANEKNEDDAGGVTDHEFVTNCQIPVLLICQCLGQRPRLGYDRKK